MKATVKTFQSGCGDCIFLILMDEANGETYHVLIDCGKFTSEIKNFIMNDLNFRIDMLIVSHYDNDHVLGLIDMLKDIDLANLEIEKIIYNCFQDYDMKDVASISDENRIQLDRYASNIHPSKGLTETKIGAPQASLLCLVIKSNPKWYNVWDKKVVVEGDTINLGDNGKWGVFHVLSPSKDALDALKHDFIKEYTKCVHECPPNKASLALIWECNGKKILFGGDAVASQLYKAIRDLYRQEYVLFEAIKIPHHGSKNNMSNELALLIDTEQYFLTGGKKREGPNYETLAKIILHPLNNDVSLHTIHYNRVVNLSELNTLAKKENNELLSELNAKMINEKEYTFEY